MTTYDDERDRWYLPAGAHGPLPLDIVARRRLSRSDVANALKLAMRATIECHDAWLLRREYMGLRSAGYSPHDSLELGMIAVGEGAWPKSFWASWDLL